LLISDRNIFRVLLEKKIEKLLPYILFEKYTYILALEMASPGNQHCANCVGNLYGRYAAKIYTYYYQYSITPSLFRSQA